MMDHASASRCGPRMSQCLFAAICTPAFRYRAMCFTVVESSSKIQNCYVINGLWSQSPQTWNMYIYIYKHTIFLRNSGADITLRFGNGRCLQPRYYGSTQAEWKLTYVVQHDMI